MQFTFFFILL